MKTVKLKREFVPDRTVEVDVPNGCFKERVFDYQDPEPYYKYFYINKHGVKKECNIKFVK